MFIKVSIATPEEQLAAGKVITENDNHLLFMIRAILCGDRTWDDLRLQAYKYYDTQKKLLSREEREVCDATKAIWDAEKQQELRLGDEHESLRVTG